MDLKALGDFPPTGNTSENLSLTAQNITLGLPLSTLALEASASPDSSDQTFIGYGDRSGERLDVLLWPRGSACDLYSGGSYPDQLGGQALGYGNTSGLVMVAGSNQHESPSVVGALTFDTRTGDGGIVDPRGRSVLSVARAFATVSDFGGKLLVAGGENSIFDSAPLNDSAEIYDPTLSSPGFEPELLKLAVPRAHHAAVSLVSGEVALLGGRGPDSNATTFVEVVTPSSRGSKLVDSLRLARNAPTALRLSDDRLFIAGGTDRDGHPVGELEWREPDATRGLDAPFDGSVALPPRFDRAFAALPGGALLAVGGCEDRPAEAGEDCAAWCARGCPPTPDATTGQRYDAYWVSPEGSVSALDFPIGAGRPVLLPGSDGRPWLVANAADTEGKALSGSLRLYRFDPWRASFDPTGVDLGLDEASSVAQFVPTGSDAFVWLDQRAQGPVLHGIRLGTRSRFSSDGELVKQRDAEVATRPAHLVSDHLPNGSPSYDSVNGVLSFAATEPGAPERCVWVTDATFSDFSLRIDFDSPVLPRLRLGASSFADAASADQRAGCQLPAPAEGAQGGSLLLDRRGSSVTLTLGGARSECTVGVARVPVALCASDLGATRITLLRVTRAG